MKSNKVLLGLFAGVLALIGGSVSAQNSNFFEIGPSNIGGHVSCLVADEQDNEHITLYAGAATGGLYVMSNNTQVLQNLYQGRDMAAQWVAKVANDTTMWHYIPFVVDGKQVVLPISAMVQCPAPERTILVATGSDDYQIGSNYSPMSRKGCGIYKFNIDDNSFTLIPGTNTDDFAAVHAINLIYRNGKMYVYAATSTGLFRWSIASENDWNRSYERVFTGRVDQLLVVNQLKMVYFSQDGSLYKISDATADVSPSTPLWHNISSTNSEFGSPRRALKLAVASSDPSYLYVMVVDSTGRMQNVYLSRNAQTWYKLATTTVLPFSYNSGFQCGAVAVDPGDPMHIYLAGTSIYSGSGFVEGNLFQWMSSSLSEYQLNSGNYMQYVYNSSYFVHSGIHQILPVYRANRGRKSLTYYIATDGGVYSTNSFSSYTNLNNGLNNLEINSIAVTPDGSLLSGANHNACPFIESRNSHNGGSPEYSWFDDGSRGNINHAANIIWQGNGGKVAASKFEQLSPELRRNIYVSSEGGRYARAYKNYFDFTDNQVWTYGKEFMSADPLGGGPQIGKIVTWETDNDSLFNDSIDVSFDTLLTVMRPNTAGDYDTILVSNSRFTFAPGDKVQVLSRANSEYPFEYTFTENHKVTDRIRVKNPIQARTFMIACDSNKSAEWGVYMSWRASDFTKVFDATAVKDGLYDGVMLWSRIYYNNTRYNPQVPRDLVVSEDGRFVFIAIQNQRQGTMILRLRGFENVDYSRPPLDILNFNKSPMDYSLSKIKYDTLKIAPGNVWIPRMVSSMTLHGDSILLTFEGYDESSNFANAALITKLSAGTMVFKQLASDFSSQPAYSGMIEKTTGNIYVGTDDGVMIYNGQQWSQYQDLAGVPVTAIVQQQDALPVRHYTLRSPVEGQDQKYVFSKTKWPNAIYFGTYGRGIFADLSYVTDTVNEVSDSSDYIGIPTVNSSNFSTLSIYPNPVTDQANLSVSTAVAGEALLRIYDLNGRCIAQRSLGYATEGNQVYTVGLEGMSKGMYLVNVIIGGHTAAAKMMVR